MLAGHGFTFQGWNVVDMEFPKTVDDADGWLISGSRHGAYEDLPFIPPLESFIHDIYSAKIPLVGICFGHQVMAQALGGRVQKFSDGWAVGNTDYQFQDGVMSLNAFHQDQVVEAPDMAQTIATNEFCKYAGFAYPNRAMSVQAHPEFGLTEMTQLLELRAPKIMPQDLVNDAKAKLEVADDNAAMARQIADFFKGTTNG